MKGVYKNTDLESQFGYAQVKDMRYVFLLDLIVIRKHFHSIHLNTLCANFLWMKEFSKECMSLFLPKRPSYDIISELT